LAPYLVPLLAPGFSDELKGIAISLTRVMLLSPFFMGLSGVFQGIENAHKKFLGLALAPIFYNLSIIASAYFFAPKFGVNALAIGVVIGAICHFLVQVPGTFHTSFHFKLARPILTPEIKEFFTLLLPRLMGNAVFQASAFVDTLLATTLTLGSLSVFNYALNLQSLPYGVVAVSFSTAVFSTLSEQADEHENFFTTFKRTFNRILFWVFPATIGLYFLREPIVRVLLEGGRFDEAAVQMTVLTLGFFIWAAIPQSMIPLFSRGFYSRKETWLPVILGTIGMSLAIIFGVLLVKFLHLPVYGLAISNLIATTIYAALLIIFLFHKLKISLFRLFDLRFFMAISCGLILMLGVLFIVAHYFSASPLLFLAIGGAGGAAAYFVGYFGVRRVSGSRI
jgi:putative peptidoglycan lipid II flippase